MSSFRDRSAFPLGVQTILVRLPHLSLTPAFSPSSNPSLGALDRSIACSAASPLVHCSGGEGAGARALRRGAAGVRALDRRPGSDQVGTKEPALDRVSQMRDRGGLAGWPARRLGGWVGSMLRSVTRAER